MYQHHHLLCSLFQTSILWIIRRLYYPTLVSSTNHYRSVIYIFIIGSFVPYYVSVAALTSKGRGEFKTKVAFTMQGSKSEKLDSIFLLSI